MRAILEGYKGKHPASKRGRGKWYKITEREFSGATLETTPEDLLLIRKSKCVVVRWRVIADIEGAISIKINKSADFDIN